LFKPPKLLAESPQQIRYGALPLGDYPGYEVTDLFGNFLGIPKELVDNTLPCVQFCDVNGNTFSVPERFFEKDLDGSLHSLLSLLKWEADNLPPDNHTKQSFLLMLRVSISFWLSNRKRRRISIIVKRISGRNCIGNFLNLARSLTLMPPGVNGQGKLTSGLKAH
jgi:hypothetical protein